MKIFQGTVEVAGQMGMLTGALKRRGHLVTAYNTFHSYLDYRHHLINTDRETISRMFRYMSDTFDIYHFHYCYTFFEDLNDLQRLKEKGKKIVMHHWGDDVRQLRHARLSNPYVNTSGSFPDEYIQQRLEYMATYVDAAIVQDVEVLSYVTPFYKKSFVLPIAIQLDRFPVSTFPEPRRKPLIVHAPTNPEFKGTPIIERVMDSLRKDYEFDYLRVAGMSNEEAASIYRQADLIIDQVLCGSYGLFSCEAMALGKAVVCYIRDDIRAQLPSDLPIISANPDTLESTLRHLLSNPHLMVEFGALGRNYVEKMHDINRVGEQLSHIYAQI